MNKKQILLSILILLPLLLFPQDGVLDNSFHENGIVTTDFYNHRDLGMAVAQQNDGKIVASGSADDSDNNTYHALVRYEIDGALDTSFGEEGKVTTYLQGSYLDRYNSILFQGDNKIIASGSVGDYAHPNFLITRYLPNGDLDASFWENGVVVTTIYGDDDMISTKLLDDGKIIAGGFSKNGDDYFVTLVRYLTNGDLDQSFGNNGIKTTYLGEGGRVFKITILNNGKILIGAKKRNNNLINFVFLRYSSNGLLDTSFGDNGIVTTNLLGDSYGSFSVRSNGKIVVSIRENQFNEPILAQFHPDGSPDLSFGENGEITINSTPYFIPLNVLIQEDEKILVQGNIYGFEGGEFRLQRFNSNGSSDSSFGNNGVVMLGFESSDILFQTDGKILAVGNTLWFNGYVDFTVVRYHNSILSNPEQFLNRAKIYPNPSNGIFNINHDGITSETPYQITDITGKVIQTGKLSGEQTEVNLSTVQSGMYLLTASGSTFRLIKK